MTLLREKLDSSADVDDAVNLVPQRPLEYALFRLDDQVVHGGGELAVDLDWQALVGAAVEQALLLLPA